MGQRFGYMRLDAYVKVDKVVAGIEVILIAEERLVKRKLDQL